MTEKRKHYSAEQKVKIVRELLDNNVALSDLSKRYNVHPNMIMKWKKALFEGALETFNRKHDRQHSAQDTKIAKLKQTLQDRDSLIAEIVSDNIRLKKNLNGEIFGPNG